MFQKTADYYNMVIKMTRLIVIILDLDGKVARVNKNFENYFWNDRSKLI